MRRFLVPGLPSVALLAVACVGNDPTPAPTATADAGGGPGTPPGASSDAGGAEGGSTPADGGDAGGGREIDGHVTDVYAQPLANATVRAGNSTTTTDSTGHFHLAGVPSTYDLDVVGPSTQNGKALTSFRGLTTANPEANVEGFYVLRAATVSGSISGTITLGASEHLRVSTVDRKTGFDYEPVATDDTGSWSGTTNWLGGATTDATFWFLRYTSPDGIEGTPTSYASFALIERSGVSEVAGDSTLSTGLTAVTNTHVQGSVTAIPAPGASALLFVGLKNTNDRYGHMMQPLLNVSGAFSFPTPTGIGKVNVVAQAGGNVGVLAETHKVWKVDVAPNATGVALAFGDPSVPVSPSDGSTTVKNDAAFSWTAGSPAGIYRLTIRCGSGASEYAAVVYTTAMTATPSDGSALGAAWPAGATSCTWGVTLFQTITTVDAVVKTAGALNELDHPNGPRDGAYVDTWGYGFKTP